MLNLVAHEEGNAAAILIRAAEPICGLEIFKERRPKAKRDEDLLSGPGKLAAAFEIGPWDNALPLLDTEEGLHLLPPTELTANIVIGTRVGIAIGKAHDLPWRFADADRLRWVSRPLTFD
jgi:DNA-3-methyladenine glycosylase